MNKEPSKGLNGALSAQIRAERGAAGLTVVELAAAIGVSKSKMLAMLKPSIGIDIPELAALSDVFGIEPVELMKRAQARVKP